MAANQLLIDNPANSTLLSVLVIRCK